MDPAIVSFLNAYGIWVIIGIIVLAALLAKAMPPSEPWDLK